jgi:hypothetical protein
VGIPGGIIGYGGIPRLRAAITDVFGAEEIIPPGLILESDRPEWSLVKRERLWSLDASLTASVGNFNKFILQPTINSDVLCVLTHVISSIDCFLSITEALVVAATAGAFVVLRDGRRGANARGSTRIFTKQEATLTSVDARYLVRTTQPPNVPPFIDVSGALTPGILIESTVVNSAQQIWLAGYERIARKEELADL